MNCTHLDDRELADALVAGSRPALAEVHRRHAGQVVGMARRILKSHELAEEVAQEVFLRLWDRPEAYDPGRGSMRSFLLAHVHGRSLDLIRAESARRAREEREARMVVDPTPSVDDEVWVRVQSAGLRAVLAAIPTREREAIELAYLEGLTYRQVAEQLSLPEGTVKSRIRAGLQRLKTDLAGVGLAVG